jgi:hypothetical protein
MEASATTNGEIWVAGRSVWALSIGVDILAPISAGLRDLGANIVSAGDGSTSAADACVEAAARRASAPDLVLASVLPQGAVRLTSVCDLDEADWTAVACVGLRSLIHLLQAVGPYVKGRGVAVVLVGPSLSLVGCTRLVALSTLLEGQRGLMKSVARQWGLQNVSLNWIAVAPGALSPIFDHAPLATKPDMVSIALGRPPDPRSQVAPIIGFLGSPAGRAITGATLVLDGGEWMVP